MKILHIDSATTGEKSVSRKLTRQIVDHLKQKYPGAEVVYRDFAADPLPHLDHVTTGAIRLPADQHNDDMQAAFPQERAVLDEFLSSDIVVVGAPMYNFTIPSQLKAWLDRLGVPRVTFGYSEKGPEGYAGGRRVIVASSRGGSYEQGGPAEHQETLLKNFFGFIGIPDVEFIRAEGAGMGPEALEKALSAAAQEIEKL